MSGIPVISFDFCFTKAGLIDRRDPRECEEMLIEEEEEVRERIERAKAGNVDDRDMFTNRGLCLPLQAGQVMAAKL